MPTTQPIEPENQQKSGEWQGDKSMPEVEALLAFGVSITKIAKRFGVRRETISRRLSKKNPTSPDTDRPGSNHSDEGILPTSATPGRNGQKKEA